MRKGAILLACISALMAGPGGAGPRSPAPALTEPAGWSLFVERLRGPAAAPAACCMVCSKGKACGNACISRDKTCRKGAGCACDG